MVWGLGVLVVWRFGDLVVLWLGGLIGGRTSLKKWAQDALDFRGLAI